MKKIIAMLMAILMLASLTACGAKEAPAETAAPAAEEGTTVYKIGICQLVQHVALDAATQGFMDRLTELCGGNVEFDLQNASGDPAATADIPILGTSVTEYGVAMDIKDFNGTVGGNISGTSDLAPLDKQAEMVKEWFPDAQNVGLLYCSSEANSQYQVDTVKAYLEELGFTCQLYAFTDSNDMQAVTQTAATESDVIYIPTDNTAAAGATIIDPICQAEGVPVIAGEEGICANCGVATLSISYYDLGVKTAEMAYQILTGEADISTMPIGYADKQTPKYNAAICEALGLAPLEGYEAIG